MGLAERRKIKELEDTVLPGREKELAEICPGSAIRYEIDWASFDGDLPGLNFLDNLSCHRLNMALRVICADELGKDAVRDALKFVKLRNAPDKGSMRMSFAGGALEMHCAYKLGTEGMFSDGEIRAALMKSL